MVSARIAQLSSTSSPSFQPELTECWNIVSHELKMTLGGVTSGAIGYLQMRFFEEVKAFVYNHLDAHLGGIPDAWSLVKAHGRLKFQTSTFPSNATHVWYAAFVAARAGLTELLLELPQRAAPTSEQCPMLRGVCSLMAKRLQVVLRKHKCFNMFRNVSKCFEMFREVLRYVEMFQDVLTCFQMFRDVARCFKMCRDDSRCSEMFRDASRLVKMLEDVSVCFETFGDVQDVSRCLKMFPDVPKCFNMFRDVARCWKTFQDFGTRLETVQDVPI